MSREISCEISCKMPRDIAVLGISGKINFRQVGNIVV
jgi:hypothetical protein